MSYPGLTGTVCVSATSHSGGEGALTYTSYFGGTCSASYGVGGGYNMSVSLFGATKSKGYQFDFNSSWAEDFGVVMAGYNSDLYDAFLQCLATEYARENIPGYADCKPGLVTGDVASPLKMNLANGNAEMNSTTPTGFVLTLQDGRGLESHVKGGLNADEGWLMVHRDDDPLVLPNGLLNANDWFGDRDHRSLNGYTDLAETFKDFIAKDEFEKRYIPLHVLGKGDKARKAQDQKPGLFSDPSFDLRIVDASGKELFASDYFDRIYIDYRKVTESDEVDGKGGRNQILERGMVHTLQGENHGAVDQWFILDIPSNYVAGKDTKNSKVWPAPASGQ